MKIAFDLDGVLYDFHAALYTELVSLHNLNQSFNEFWSTGWLKISEERFKNYVAMEHIYETLPPSKEVKEFMKEVNNKHTIYYITSRQESLKYITKKFLRKNEFPQRENLFFNTDKSIVVRSYDIDMLIDDQAKYLEKCKPFCKCILVRQLYNVADWTKYDTIGNVLELKGVL
jgi:uncharacterized HAD superfamily protein